MDLLDLINPDTVAMFLLYMVRTGAFLFVAPIFGGQGESRMLRMILGISLGFFIWKISDPVILPHMSLTLLAALGVREAIIGLVIGFSLRSIAAMLAVAGEIISHEMGFSMARALNPVTGTQSTPMAQLFESMAYLLILNLDIHHELIRIIRDSYNLVPVGHAFSFEPVYERLRVLIGTTINLGLQYASPVFGVMLLLTVTLMILSRAVQNINLMEFSFALRILLALIASLYFLGEGTPFLVQSFNTLLDMTRELFVGVT